MKEVGINKKEGINHVASSSIRNVILIQIDMKSTRQLLSLKKRQGDHGG
ncbi:hypothetical protein T458_15310 [Brevibacillus panacihumi W25]|uniref:Uncharacterized protein n=1 Tax=Brevibacillus panacihumi W25 TaxID=1408254 RepID=V6M5D0_9BACL|nr:hypothetical protein T458_15310 [Brevibacillus panacihumi W25]